MSLATSLSALIQRGARSVLVTLGAALALSIAGQAQDASNGVVGAWSAAEEYYRAVILIERDEVGSFRAYFASDDLSPGAPFSSAEVRGDSVFLEAADVGARFAGAFLSDGPTIRGTYSQGEISVPLTLVPAMATETVPAARPQHPVPPFPYVTEEVTFQSESPGVLLVGTLTIPDGPGPHPAVVLVSGTGDNDRDYEVYGHRPFLVLADYLTRNGVAVLRYDERSAGASGGDSFAMSFNDEARDAAAAVRGLRSRPEIDAGRVGIVGHSIGGVHAPFVHQRLERVSFLVLLMAPSVPLGDLFREQTPRMTAASGAPRDVIDSGRQLGYAIIDAAAADTDSLTAAQAMSAAFETAGYPEEVAEAAIRANTSPAYRGMVRYDPTPVLERLNVPVLAVYGRADLAVTPEENAGPMEAALAASPNVDVEVLVLDRINHYLQTSETGSEAEAAATEVTVAPELLEVITRWIVRHVDDD